jgi:hypothetical protein
MPEPTHNETEDAMKNPLAALAAAAGGALAMYYLDPELGAKRRALLSDLLRSGLPRQRDAQGRGRTTRRTYHRLTQSDPRSDAELRDRIHERLGRLVSFPRALDVSVTNGMVRLTGRVLAKERDGLLHQLREMPGVQKLVNAMTAHDKPQDIADPGAVDADGQAPRVAA